MYVYTVFGSEDHILGVYGNKRTAMAVAKYYTGTESFSNQGKRIFIFYGESTTATVEKHDLCSV